LKRMDIQPRVDFCDRFRRTLVGLKPTCDGEVCVA